jgi:hypothetical protein
VYVSGRVPRARPGTPGIWRITRTGSTNAPLVVRYTVSGSAESDKDYVPLTGSITIRAGASSSDLVLTPASKSLPPADRMVIVTLTTGDNEYHVGCPNASLIVIPAAE